MRFLFVGRFPEMGGSALATLPLIDALRQAGHTIQLAHWVMPQRTDWFADRDLLDLDLAKQGNLFSKIFYLTRTATNYDAIIAISELTPTYACQIAGWLSHCPVYGELQVHLDHWIQGNSAALHSKLVRWFYPRLAGLRCVSQALATYAVDSLYVSKDKAFVVYNGFDLQTIRAQASQPLPSEVQAWFSGPVILAVGRLCSQKRFDLAIQAFAIAREQLPPETRLVIVGEGSLRSELQVLIDQLNLQNSVHLAGLQPNPFPFFAQATAFLLSSDYEGFGRVLIEAMACGCPVIAHDCPVGPKEVLQSGKCGVLVLNNEPTTMAEAMVSLLANSKHRHQLIQSGYQRLQDFDQAQLSQQYMGVLETRLKGKG